MPKPRKVYKKRKMIERYAKRNMCFEYLDKRQNYPLLNSFSLLPSFPAPIRHTPPSLQIFIYIVTWPLSGDWLRRLKYVFDYPLGQ